MRGTKVVATLGAIVLGTRFIDAQEPPALEPPLEATTDAPSGTPPEPPPVERPRPSAPPPSRPFLVIPGVTVPSSRPSERKPPADAPDVAPALDAPIVAPDIHLRLEPIPDAPTSRSGERAAEPRQAPDRGATPGPSSAEATTRGPAAAFERRPAAAEGPGESIDDPAVEAAVKRRVEKQAAEALDGRLADLKVRVYGRTIQIHALMTRFWYRWGARRTLEALPMPAGYRARVIVD